MPDSVMGMLRPDLRELIPYHVPVHSGVVKLDANENAFPFPTAALNEILEGTRAAAFNRYPDGEAKELRQAIALRHGLEPDQVMVGNGSDELIQNLMLAFGVGGKVLITVPTFGMYGIHARIAGARPVPVARREDFAVDTGALIGAARDPDVRMIVICTPNNPTGNAMPLADLEAVLDETRAVVVVDEAYIDFGGEPALPLVARHPRLVLLRTFSKAFALAGLRVGYLIAQQETVGVLWRVKQPYNVNTFSQLAAEVVLRHHARFTERIALILNERERLFEALRGMPQVEPFPTDANFILVRTPVPGNELYQRLLDRGVLVRNLKDERLARCLRVSVGTPDENQVFLQALSDALGGGR